MTRSGRLGPGGQGLWVEADGEARRVTWYRLYEDEGIEGASFGYDGSTCRLSDAQQDKLRTWIAETLPRTTREVGVWIETECGVTADAMGSTRPTRAARCERGGFSDIHWQIALNTKEAPEPAGMAA
jgi:hypothetical protein